MSRAVLKKKKKKKPILSEFVPKAYPNQKVQGGMGVLMPEQFRGGVATGDHSPVQSVLEEPVKKKDTSNFVPVVINPNTSMAYTVMLDPENNSVHSDNSEISNMMLKNVDREKIALEAANQQHRQNTVVDPYQEAEKNMGVATDKFNLAVQKELPAGGYLDEFTDAQDEATAILGNDVAPNVIDGVLNKTNTYRQAPHALEALEAQNPYEQQEKKAFSEAEAILNAPTEDKPVLKNDQYDPIDDMVAGENLYPYTPTPDGNHRMPDGTLMADSEMQSADGVLSNNNDVPAKGNGILNTTTTASQDRMSSPVTANARGSAMPYGKVGRNEMLMRMGAKMMAGSVNGHGAGMDAAFTEYGNIKDANRQADTDAFNKAEVTRLAEERIAALKAKGSAKDTNQNQEASNLIGDRISDFESGLQAIADSKAAGGNLTGVGGVFKSLFDNFSGDADAARRLLLKRLQVNDTLLRTAETKGAISNFEMTLFKSPTPTNLMDEKIWSEWINARLNALRNQQYRLKNGIVLPESERSNYFKNRPSGVEKPTTSRNTTVSKKSQNWLDS